MPDIRADRTTAAACPRCGGPAVPIFRGLPSLEAFKAADRGEIVLGGCIATDDDPDLACTGFDCGIHFSSPGRVETVG